MDLYKLVNEHKYSEDEISKHITAYLKKSTDYVILEKSIKSLIDCNKTNMFYYNLLLKVYAFVGDEKLIEKNVKNLINIFSGNHFDDYLNHLKNVISEQEGVLISSKLVTNLKKGSEHIGFIDHVVEWNSGNKEEYITKIISKNFIGNECFFYEHYKLKFSTLQPNVPRVLDVYYTKKGWGFVTMKKIKGITPDLINMTESNLLRLINISFKIGQYRGKELYDWFKTKNEYSDFEIGLSENYLIRSFAHIYKREFFYKINQWVIECVSNEGYNADIVEHVKKVVFNLNEIEFYKRIDLYKHYSFNHGSFYHNNIIYSDSEFKVVDWAHFNFAPKGCDIALLLRRLSFQRTLSILEEKTEFNKLDDVNKIIWAYACIVVSLMINIDPIKKEPSNQLFIPACEFILQKLKNKKFKQ